MKKINYFLLLSLILVLIANDTFAGAGNQSYEKIIIEDNSIPTEIRPGDKPITLNKDILAKIIPELLNPRIMSLEDLKTYDEEALFLEGGYTFVLRGDFNRDGFADIIFVGKYDGETDTKGNSFIAILSIQKNKIVREFLSKILRDRISIIRVINHKNDIDAIGMSYNLESDDCGYLYWSDGKWVYELCRSVF